MRKYLLPENGKFYKANLHCHTTVTDGELTPEEIKKLYMDHGYSVVAYTDHEIMVPHHDLTDENFVALTGVENSFGKEGKPDFLQTKECHICFIAQDPENVTQPCWHRTKYHNPKADAWVTFDEKEPDFERIYTPECINEMIRIFREKGFFATYNHPVWSLEGYEDYMQYEGMSAMEIFNYSSALDGYADYNPNVYDDFLKKNKRMYAIATDDNHNRYPGTRKFDSFGGFTMIKAEKLEYRAITKALENGHFYASMGPEIKALWYENGMVHLECSPAEKIIFTVGQRRTRLIWTNEGEFVTEADFDINANDVYFRITVIDEKGRCADTNAYFYDDLNA